MLDERLRTLERRALAELCPDDWSHLARELRFAGMHDRLRSHQNRLLSHNHFGRDPDLEKCYMASGGLWLRETDTDFEYFNVPIFDRVEDITIRKQYLEGTDTSQQGWFERLKDKPERLPTAPELMGITLATYDLRDVEVLRTQVQHAHTLLSNPARRWRPATSTSVLYRPAEPTDSIYYDKNNPAEQPTPATVRGNNAFISEAHADLLEKLVGTQDTERIIAVRRWLTNNATFEPYLWRINPSQPTERAVVLGVYVAWFGIVASDVIVSDRPALGVVKRSAKNSP